MKFHDAKRFLENEGIRTPCVDEELQWLNLQAYHISCAYPDGVIVEGGTLNGGSAIVMGAGIKLSKTIGAAKRNAKLWTVDNYQSFTDGKNPDLLSQDEIEELIVKAGLSEEVDVIRQDDIEFLQGLAPNSVNMLFIDSLHTYNHVYDTLKIAIPIMAPNSLLCGHDYCLPGHEVVYAVDDFIKTSGKYLSGFGVHYKIWWTIVRKKQTGYMKRG